MHSSVLTIIAIVLGLLLGFVLAVIIIDVTYSGFGIQTPGSVVLLLPLVGAGLGIWVVNRRENKQ